MSRVWMRNWNEDRTREVLSEVAEEFGGELRVDNGGNEYVLCYDHGRQVSVFHKEQVKFSFKVCGNREKVREGALHGSGPSRELREGVYREAEGNRRLAYRMKGV